MNITLSRRVTAGISSKVDIRTCLNVLWEVREKWRYIEIELGFQPSDISNIAREDGDNGGRLTTVITRWLRTRNPKPSWETIIKALKARTVDEGGLAEDIATQLHVGVAST